MISEFPEYHTRSVRLAVAALVIVLSCLAANAKAVDHVAYALCDIRVLYVYDDERTIDWPGLYHLNDNHACRIELLTFRPGGEFRVATTEITEAEFALHRVFGRERDAALIDSSLNRLFDDRNPDIVVIGDIQNAALRNTVTHYFTRLAIDSARIFSLSRVYVQDAQSSDVDSLPRVLVNSQELADRYRVRMEREIPQLLPGFRPTDLKPARLTPYRLVRQTSKRYPPGPEMISGLPKFRLSLIIDSLLPESPVRRTLGNHARNYQSFFTMATNASGRQRIENLVAGQKEIVTLGYQVRSESSLSRHPEFQAYLQSLSEQAQAALLREINLDWDGRIFWRDSPHGPKLKFRASLAVNSPETVELSYVHFHPHWDTAVVVLDDVSRKVTPHQMFVREYLVDVDRRYLESDQPDSLVFSAEIVFGQIPLPVVSAVPVRHRPGLSISFQPDFHFVPPVATINVDQVVSSMNWKAVITKPLDYSGEVMVDLVTPRGVFAGAYRQHWNLEKGRSAETIRIPFSVSNLFGQGVHFQTISLLEGGQELAADTGRIRIAECKIDDRKKIGFLPDSTGVLEDILRMTNATFQPLTNRAFVTADIDAYNVIVVGSGAFRDYPSLQGARDRLEDYLRYGGSLVILGQPSDWPEGILPVSFLPGQERITADMITTRIPKANVLSQPYKINQEHLLGWFERARDVSAAVVAPSERVFVTPTGATLLSVSRLGDGQIIYCGLPLQEMIAELHLESIHLLANILNY